MGDGWMMKQPYGDISVMTPVTLRDVYVATDLRMNRTGHPQRVMQPLKDRVAQ